MRRWRRVRGRSRTDEALERRRGSRDVRIKPVEVVSFLMHQKMLRGIRKRAEGTEGWDYNQTVIVRRPPAAVYAILADQQAYGDHSPDSLVPLLEKVPDEPTRAGTRWHEVVRLSPFSTMTIWSTVTVARPPERLEMEWSGPWMHGSLAYTFEACPEGTAFRQQETFVPEGPLRLVGGLLSHALFRRVAARQLAIRDIAEGPASGGGIVITGVTDNGLSGGRMQVAQGRYHVRALYRGLTSISEDGLSGDDHYLIELWPASAESPPPGKSRVRRGMIG